MDRRSFLLTSMMAATAMTLGVPAFPKRRVATHRGSVKARVGILSDIHVTGPDCDQLKAFERALIWFRENNADGVLLVGDMVDRPSLQFMELIGKTWLKVFPDDKGLDGRRVEKLFVTGNHDFKVPETDIDGVRREDAWKRFYGLDWEQFSIKDINGYKFVLANYAKAKEMPGLGEFMEAHASELKGDKPFFYCQHQHPKGTCSAPWTIGQDNGETTEILGKFPNCVAVSGHSHTSLTDERTIWQGSFTSVGAASMYWISSFKGRENSRTKLHYIPQDLRMKPLDTHDGKQGMLMSIYGDAIVFQRREFVYDQSLGPDWVLPLPLLKGGPVMDFEGRAGRAVAPEFARGAKVSISGIVAGKGCLGNDEMQQIVSFPSVTSAVSGIRAFDYEVCLEVQEADIVRVCNTKRVFSEGYYLGERNDVADVKCVFADFELPDNLPYRYVVRPVECFGKKGRAICSGWLNK